MSVYDPTPRELVADVRKRLTDHPHGWLPSDGTTMRRLADALETALAEQGTEEPEWEYGYELIESDTRDVHTRSGAFGTEEAARHWARKAHKDESDPEYPPLDVLIVRRRGAGPWLPVGQGGDDAD